MKTTIITTLILILSATATLKAREDDRYYYVYNYYNFWIDGELPGEWRYYYVFSQVLVMDDECISENYRNIINLFEMAVDVTYFDSDNKWDGYKPWKSGEIKIEEIKYVNGISEANMKRAKIAKDEIRHGRSGLDFAKWIDIPIDIDCVED